MTFGLIKGVFHIRRNMKILRRVSVPSNLFVKIQGGLKQGATTEREAWQRKG